MSIARNTAIVAVLGGLALLATGIVNSQNLGLIERSDCPKIVTVPFTQGKHPGPIVEVQIGGKTRRMLMDTGAGACVVQQSLIDELGLKPFVETTARDPGGKNSMKVGLYRIPEIKIGGATFYGALAFVQPEASKKQVGSEVVVDGVLSYGVFRDQLLVVDYPNKTMSFGPGELPSSAATFKLRSNTPEVDVAFGDVKVSCQVDTGAQGGLMVPLSFKNKLPLDSEPKVTGKTSTLFNTMEVWEAKLKGPVGLMGRKLEIPTVEMHEGFPIGNVGGKLLEKFKLTIDQKNKRIELADPARR